MKQVGPAEMGWMAAVIDLRGRIVYKKNQMRATPQIVLYVETKELQVIKRLGELVGTAPEYTAEKALKDWMQRGCSEHCPEPHVHHEASWQMPQTGKWTLTGAAAAMVLWNLEPYLSVDKGWDELISKVLRQATLKNQGSGATLKAIGRLLQLGWKAPPLMIALIEPGKYKELLPAAKRPVKNPHDATACT